MLRNHGLLTCGSTIADAFLSMYVFESACQIQISAQSGGGELTQVHPQIIEGVAHAMKVQTGGLGGQFAWPALLRKLHKIDPGYSR
ncbi:MAG: class II aldolase/adducin family protein, partial [Comamonas sp.]